MLLISPLWDYPHISQFLKFYLLTSCWMLKVTTQKHISKWIKLLAYLRNSNSFFIAPLYERSGAGARQGDASKGGYPFTVALRPA